jgi:hypothetical protein
MRLLTALLLSTVALFAGPVNRLPNTRKTPPPRTLNRPGPGGPTMKGYPKMAGKGKPTKGRAKTGAVARAFAGSGKARATTHHSPRPR